MPKPTHWQTRTQAALSWVHRSIEACKGQGSAHSYSPLRGWAKAYPETTGYLLPTLLRYADRNRDESLRQLARICQNWLCTQQLPSGAFPSGLAGSTTPSVFNTAMIVQGLCFSIEKNTGKSADAAVLQAVESGASWLLDLLEPDGAWRQAAYRPGFVPTYYTYAVWALLQANRVLQRPELPGRMQTALHFYARRFQRDGTVQDWGFRPGAAGFTHTIAYTLQGFLESALLLDEPAILEQTLRATDSLLRVYEGKGRLAGRYGAGWRGTYWFSCPVGTAQLSLLFARVGEITGEKRAGVAAANMLREAARHQYLGADPNRHGALPGSTPLWGPYLRFRYPSWGAKFFLDAVDLLF